MARERKVFSSPSSNDNDAGYESDDPLDLIERTPVAPSSARSRSAFAATSASPTVRTPLRAHQRGHTGAKRRKLSDESSNSSAPDIQAKSRTPTPPRKPVNAETSSEAEGEAARRAARLSPVKSRSSRVILSDGSDEEEHDCVQSTVARQSPLTNDSPGEMRVSEDEGDDGNGEEVEQEGATASEAHDKSHTKEAEAAEGPPDAEIPTAPSPTSDPEGNVEDDIVADEPGHAPVDEPIETPRTFDEQSVLRDSAAEIEDREADIAARVLGLDANMDEGEATVELVEQAEQAEDGAAEVDSLMDAPALEQATDGPDTETLEQPASCEDDGMALDQTDGVIANPIPPSDPVEPDDPPQHHAEMPAKVQPVEEDSSVSAAFDPDLPGIAQDSATADSSTPPIQAPIPSGHIEATQSSAAPSPAPSTSTSAPTPQAGPVPTGPVEEIYGYTETGRPILGYTSTGRPILGKASDARQVSISAPTSAAGGTPGPGQGSGSGLSAKDREKQRKAKVAAAAKEKEAAKAQANVEKERTKDLEAEAQRMAELAAAKDARDAEKKAAKEAEKAERERAKEMEKEAARLEREKEREGKAKGKAGKKGKVEDLKGKARSSSVSASSAKAASPDIASSTASTPEPVKPSSSASKAKNSRDRGSSVVQPSPEEDDDMDDDEVYCSCGQLGREDGNDDLVGCDACDHWFHAGCVNLKSEDLERIDSFICHNCEKITSQRTTFQKFCARAECGLMFAGRQSKFCSSSCGLKHAQTLLACVPAKSLPELAASLADFPSPPPEIRIIDHAAYPDVFDASGGGDVTGQGAFAVQTHKTTEDVMDALEAQLRAVQAQLSITAKRQQLIQGLMERCDALPSINPHTANKDGEDGRSKDKKKGKARTKPSGASSDDRPCGWSCVVLWDEQDVMDWDGQVPALPDAIAQSEQAAAGSNADGMGDEAGVEQARAEMGDWDWCDRPRKRCDRHGGWQKTAPVLLDREAEELNTRLNLLESQLAESKEAQKVMARGRTARETLHEQLALHVARKVV